MSSSGHHTRPPHERRTTSRPTCWCCGRRRAERTDRRATQNGPRTPARSSRRQKPLTVGRLTLESVRLVGVELVHIAYLAERPPHLLDDLHVFERRSHGFGRCVHGVHRGLSSGLGGDACLLTGSPRHLTGFSYPLLPLTHPF